MRSALARAIHIPVMHDFRAADVAAGGQGAPLVPVYHRALAQSLEREGPIVVLNIGGVSNVTYIDGDTLIACDTGPGNALLDDFMNRTTGQRFDCDGRMAAQGTRGRGMDRRGPERSVLLRCRRRSRSTAMISPSGSFAMPLPPTARRR